MNGADENTNLRSRSVHGAGGGSGAGDLVPVDSLDLIELPEPGQMTNMGASYDAPTGWLQWGALPASVAAVGFADDDRQLWMRPRAGTAVFPAQFDDGESFTLTAYGADGAVVETSSETVSYGRDAAATNPKVGDNVGPISGTDGAGRSFTIEPDGTPTVLFFGASWCVPCRADIAAARQAVEALGDDLRFFAVPHYADASDPWPTDIGWPDARLFPEIDSPINAVGVLPGVLILDGENFIIFAHTGFADLEESLVGFSIER